MWHLPKEIFVEVDYLVEFCYTVPHSRIFWKLLIIKKVIDTVIPLYNATFLLTPNFFTFCDKIPLIGIEFPY